MRPSIWKKYGFGWVTGWFVYVDEQQAHRQPVEIRGFALQMSRDTLENWQSEFLQLVWQVAGLTYLLYVGSPQSKEEDDRLEDKLDAILRSVDPANAERLIRALDEKYPGRYTGGI